ncbi:pyridoxamine 5'-phosphate oxidase family protein [Trujillonella humicola]|uniref:pyridoxamine 5'-phosphate oxidase family protein n=1 Tax=Trujillonella humicola TaxID=3383699 RepID=UPI003905BDC5
MSAPPGTVPGWEVHADGPPPADPLALARAWLPADDDPERPRVTLATIGADGYPAARTVLLSAFDGSGFAFHTHRDSRKVAELAAEPRAALVVLWPDLGRQLVVRGDVVDDGAEQAAAAWAARSDYLRRLAELNTAELAGLPLAERVARWGACGPAGDGPAGSWVGYRLRPREMTFWAASAETASRRLQYVRADGRWSCRPLPG